jgi:hypothetical protein
MVPTEAQRFGTGLNKLASLFDNENKDFSAFKFCHQTIPFDSASHFGMSINTLFLILVG